MTEKEYKELQLANIDSALEAGNHLLEVSRRLHKDFDDAEKKEDTAPVKTMQDTLMYYDFSAVATDISGLPESLRTFKNKLIEIKLANDRMLFEGGYRRDIDEEIARVFLSHKLCKCAIIDEAVIAAVKDGLATLDKLKAALSQG